MPISMTEKYNPKISLLYIAACLFLIFFGLFFLYLNRNELNFLDRYITSIFAIAGFSFLIKFFRTEYIMRDNKLIINTGFKEYEIAYKNIINIERRVINPRSKYRRRSGYIRGDTNTDVLVITFLDDKEQWKIMISPKEMELFTEKINKKCPHVG